MRARDVRRTPRPAQFPRPGPVSRSGNRDGKARAGGLLGVWEAPLTVTDCARRLASAARRRLPSRPRVVARDRRAPDCGSSPPIDGTHSADGALVAPLCSLTHPPLALNPPQCVKVVPRARLRVWVCVGAGAHTGHPLGDPCTGTNRGCSAVHVRGRYTATQVQISQRDAFSPSRCRAAPRGAAAPLQQPSHASLAATRGAGARSSGRMRGVNTGCGQRVISGNQSLGL